MALRNAVGRTAQRLGLGPVARAGLRAARGAREGYTESRRWNAYRRHLDRGLTFERLRGTPSNDALPVVMCLWKRPQRIADVVKQLGEQHGGRRIRLILWNNLAANGDHYRREVQGLDLGAIESIELYNAPVNVGGIGRFLAMRQIVSSGYDGPFVMLDDDEDITPAFLDDLLAAYAPRTIAGWWAFSYVETYYQRAALSQGDAATYVGTGGAVCDSALVRSDAFFRALPRRYLFLEDMWMSSVAAWNGWRLVKVETPIEFVLRDVDQHHAIFDLKTVFSEHLLHTAPLIDPVLQARPGAADEAADRMTP